MPQQNASFCSEFPLGCNGAGFTVISLQSHHWELSALGASPDCSCLCLLPQMANPVPSACCVVLAAVVVVYAQRHSQLGESFTPPSQALGVLKNGNAAPSAPLSWGNLGAPSRCA